MAALKQQSKKLHHGGRYLFFNKLCYKLAKSAIRYLTQPSTMCACKGSTCKGLILHLRHQDTAHSNYQKYHKNNGMKTAILHFATFQLEYFQ